MGKTFYVTTPIYYPNAVPHIGTAYTTVAADVLTRYLRLTRGNAFLLTGSDENGLKIVQAAQGLNQNPREYVDGIVASFQDVWHKLHIHYDDFIRTSEERHVRVVQSAFRTLREKGEIYKSYYEGWYCVHCESFWLESQLVEGNCPNQECNRPAEKVREENYFFRLSKYQALLCEYIEAHPEFIRPESRRNETLSFIRSGLQDLCVSRKSVQWGITVPEDPEYVIYVWVDALLNYISAIGYLGDEEKFRSLWPADVQLIGKDILRFHAVIWPAMLLALDLPLPKCLFVHGWLVTESGKISKSKGGSRNIHELIAAYGDDAIRYFLLREASFGLDLHFSEEALIGRINNDLANDLGNLLNRTLPMIQKYTDSVVEPPGETAAVDEDLRIVVRDLYAEVDQAMLNLQFREALIAIWKLVSRANKYIDETAPWALAREGKESRLHTVLYNIAESIRISILYMSPFLPEACRKMWQQLGMRERIETQHKDSISWGLLPPRTIVHTGDPLFPRIEAAPVSEQVSSPGA
ncbi:MAG: methionine--tRNA ligase [Armatimonadetes bacterium]|nr:methionine--tRNA ligase [Armatimonadota bacterium]